jgi:hypothetical protein
MALGYLKTNSERTVNESPTVFLKWLWTRIKSNDEGTNMTVLVLCTADLRMGGRS